MTETATLLHNCLYFTANGLARVVAKMAEEEFRVTGLSPSHAFLLMVVRERPGITPTELSTVLQLAPSTVTRFVDRLEHRGLLQRQSDGRAVGIWPTPAGKALHPKLVRAWKSLHERYAAILGREEGDAFARLVDELSLTLQQAP